MPRTRFPRATLSASVSVPVLTMPPLPYPLTPRRCRTVTPAMLTAAGPPTKIPPPPSMMVAAAPAPLIVRSSLTSSSPESRAYTPPRGDLGTGRGEGRDPRPSREGAHLSRGGDEAAEAAGRCREDMEAGE